MHSAQPLVAILHLRHRIVGARGGRDDIGRDRYVGSWWSCGGEGARSRWRSLALC
jgi:hypothetical protein